MKILTFDIEDWFHILDNDETATQDKWEKFPSRIEKNIDFILSELDQTDQKASFFCLGWVAEKYPEIIKKISSEGHHIATHSYSHQLAYNQTKEEFAEDLRKSIVILEDIIGTKIDTYRAPGFSITNKNLWAFELMANLGIKNDCSVFPANRAHGGLPNYKIAKPSIIEYGGARLKSLPINTTKLIFKNIVYSGGGYFRLFPLFFLKKKFSTDDYVMTYFHPRDFDPDQPIVAGLNRIRKFKSYVGLSSSRNKLKELLRLYKFINVKNAIEITDWNSAEVVKL